MAKKGKMKISKVKRNNQTTNKMKKQGKLKLQRHRTKVQRQKQPEKPAVEYSSESEVDSGDEWADMLDEEEQQYILSRIAKQPQLLSNVPQNEPQVNKSSKKRKKESKGKPAKRTMDSDSGAESDSSGSELEEKYEEELEKKGTKRTRDLLPIKTKAGLLPQVDEVEESEADQSQPEDDADTEEDEPKAKVQRLDDSDQSDADSGMEGTAEEEGEVTAVELLAARRNRLAHEKLRIGALCSSLLESPEKKLKNLYPILYLMEERLKDGTLNLHSVRKIATISAAEVFRDILPEYIIRHQDYSGVKLKKDTLALYKYEKELLEFYKRYLQRLEKAATFLKLKKGDTRKPDEATISLALVSLRCMCDLLVARPYFNYATNIAQSVVPFLACIESARDIVTAACVQVFQQDTKGDITLTIVRLMNQLVKKRGERLHPAALDCLLSLRIRDVDLDAEAEVQAKKRNEERKKKRIVNLSKKEKKRAKKLKEVERELLETQAQESQVARRKQMTEVTKAAFHIYFRLLKTAPHSRLLHAALNGIAKFTHVINLEYYSDLVSILRQLLSSERVGSRERMAVVRAVLSVLAGAGDALNVDPAVFHAHLYAHALDAHAGRPDEELKVVLEALSAVCSRARRVSSAVLCAFSKRLATLALQSSHHAALAALSLLNQLAQNNKSVSAMLEPDTEAGSGRYDPLLPSPEHCRADTAALFELATLLRSYHPTVRECARATLHQTTLQELSKRSPVQILEEYNGSEMSFKPAVPPPKKSPPAAKVKPTHAWAQAGLKEFCDAVESNVQMVVSKVR